VYEQRPKQSAGTSVLSNSVSNGSEIKPELVEPGYTSIFNGRDLTGWQADPRYWSVKDGAIIGRRDAGEAATNSTVMV